jgi:hypothetical protein
LRQKKVNIYLEHRNGGCPPTLARPYRIQYTDDKALTALEKLRRTGAQVVVIKDVPHPDKDVPECVSRSLDNLQECTFARKNALGYPPVDERTAERVEDARLVDSTPVVCPEKTCPAVIGDVLVYRNGAHLTPTYARTLAPWLGERLSEQSDT